MKKAIGLIAITLILLLSGCSLGESGSPPTPVTPSTLPAIQTEIAKLQNQIATIDGTIATLNTKVDTSVVVDTTPLEVSIASMNEQITLLTARMVALESGKGIVIDEGGNVTVTTPTTWSPVRWRYDVALAYKLTEDRVTYTGTELNVTPDLPEIREEIFARIEDVDPRTIKEEDLYDMELLVFNGNDDWDVNLEDVVFTLTLRPDDYAYLDEDMTYLDSDSSPYLDWDGSFVVREREGEDVTRRVEFESSKLSSFKVDEDSYEQLDLVLELYYG